MTTSLRSRPADSSAAFDVVFAAVAHPTRRKILEILHDRGGSLAAGEIASSFQQSWPTTTRHLRVLEAAGLVRVERIGRSFLYRINPGVFEVARTWLGVIDSGPALVAAEDVAGPEWAEWYGMSPVERWLESEKLWRTYLSLGGTLDPEPDTQSPFFNAEEPGAGASHGRSGMRVLRRGGV